MAMNTLTDTFSRYGQLVERAVLDPAPVEREAALSDAFQLGRSLVESDVSAVDLIGQHQSALEALGRRHPALLLNQVAQRLLVPLLELTSAHSMAHAELVQHRQDAALQAQAEQAARLEALGVLAAGMAHDFNTLLGSIRGYADLAGDLMPAEGADYLKQIELACLRASQLVRRMLSFAGQHGGAPQRQVLGNAVSEALALVRPTLGNAVQLQFDNRAPEACVLAEDGQLQQIVINLCINAGEAMSGGGRLDLWLGPAQEHPEAGAGAGHAGQLLLAVADSGCGMPPEVQARIFEPFFTTRAPRGSGLGLSVVYGIVKRMQGEIVVHSRSSGAATGTTFYLYFPEAASSPPEEAPNGPHPDC